MREDRAVPPRPEPRDGSLDPVVPLLAFLELPVQREGQVEQRIVACRELRRALVEHAVALRGIGHLRPGDQLRCFGADRVRRTDAAQDLIDSRHPAGFRQTGIALEEVGQERLLGREVHPLLVAPQALAQPLAFPLHVVRLALQVRLDLLARPPHQSQGEVQRLGAALRLVEQEVAVPGAEHGLHRLRQLLLRGHRVRLLGPAGGPGEDLLLGRVLLLQDPSPAEALDLAARVLFAVGQQLQPVGQGDARLLGLRRRGLHAIQPGPVDLGAARKEVFGALAHLGRGHRAERHAGVAEDQHEAAGPDSLGCNRKEVGRPPGRRPLPLRRRPAVRTGPDAEQREITRVAGPAPVVHLAAVLAHRAGRREDQTHVGVFDPLEEPVGHTTVERFHLTAAVRLLFTGGDQLFFLALDRLMARQVVGAGRHRGLDRGRDVLAAVGDGDAGPLACQLLAPGVGEESVLDQVPLGNRVLLEDVEGAVVVGDDQAFTGDEAAGAAGPHLDGGSEEPGPIAAPQLAGRDLQPELPQLLWIELEDLLRRPFPFHGEGLPGGERTDQNEEQSDESHGRGSVDEGAGAARATCHSVFGHVRLNRRFVSPKVRLFSNV